MVRNVFSEKLWVLPWSMLAAIAFGVAVFYLFSDMADGAKGLRWLVLRTFHILCWILLGAAALAKARIGVFSEPWAFPLAALGGSAFAIFALAHANQRTS